MTIAIQVGAFGQAAGTEAQRTLRLIASTRGQARDAISRLTDSLVSVDVPAARINELVQQFNALEVELIALEQQVEGGVTVAEIAVLNLELDRRMNDVALFVGAIDQTLRESRPSSEVEEGVTESSRKTSALAWVVLGAFAAVGIGFLLATERATRVS